MCKMVTVDLEYITSPAQDINTWQRSTPKITGAAKMTQHWVVTRIKFKSTKSSHRHMQT